MPPTVDTITWMGRGNQPTAPAAARGWQRRRDADLAVVWDAVSAFEGAGDFPDFFYDNKETFPLDALRVPEEAEGMCSSVSRAFADYCCARGLVAYDSGADAFTPGYDRPRNPLLGTAHGADDFGYTDRTRESSEPEHSATVIELDEQTLLVVDWACAQYGYTDFPLVQRRTPQGWARMSRPQH